MQVLLLVIFPLKLIRINYMIYSNNSERFQMYLFRLNFVTKGNKGFAFVEFEEKAAAEKAVASNQEVILNGRKLYINWATPKDKKGVKPPIRKKYAFLKVKSTRYPKL